MKYRGEMWQNFEWISERYFDLKSYLVTATMRYREKKKSEWEYIHSVHGGRIAAWNKRADIAQWCGFASDISSRRHLPSPVKPLPNGQFDLEFLQIFPYARKWRGDASLTHSDRWYCKTGEYARIGGASYRRNEYIRTRGEWIYNARAKAEPHSHTRDRSFHRDAATDPRKSMAAVLRSWPCGKARCRAECTRIIASPCAR